jgi:2-hydroxychromene-2-carboxylate isomerase
VRYFKPEFGGGKRIDDSNLIGSVLADLKLDAAALLVAAQSTAIKDKLRTETAEAQQLGIFGAPSFVTADGELFWGNDRLVHALAWTKRAP